MIAPIHRLRGCIREKKTTHSYKSFRRFARQSAA
jgi:hypothetical protein